MFDYCLFVRDQYVKDCITLGENWLQAIEDEGAECHKKLKDSEGDCWRLKKKTDKVEVTAPDGSKASHNSFEKARIDLLPRPGFSKLSKDFGGMKEA